MKFLGLTQNNSEDFTNAQYVAQQIEIQGGKIDTISVDGVEQEIVNKNVNIDLTGKADKTAVPVKSMTSAKGEALLWNEASGGGAKFTNVNGVESFVGVNDGTNGLVAQIYADKFEAGKWNGAKLDVANTGIYYTVGNKSAVERMVAENEVATIGDIQAVNNYNIEKLETAESGYIASYKLVDATGAQKGATINIPKDFLVKSAELKTCTQDNVPVEGYRVGDKYIDFVINSKDASVADSHIYIKVTELVDVYKADEATLTLDKSTNTFSIKSEYTEALVAATEAVDGRVDQEILDRQSADTELQSSKLDIMPGDAHTAGNAYNLPYYFHTNADANKVTVTAETVTLDGKKTYGSYSMDVTAATDSTAGLMSAADKIRLDSIEIPTKVSQLENDVPYLTEHQSLSAYRTSASQDLIDAGKQDVISDLTTIRTGAGLGATAVQPTAIADMATKSWVEGKGYLTQHQDISGKQDKLTAGNNITITDNVISADKAVYTAGNGVSINDNTISTKLGYGLKYTDDGKITLHTDSTIAVSEFGARVPYVSTSLDNTLNGLAVKLADDTIEAYNSGTGQKGLRVNQNIIQPKLTAGTNIQITGNTISATDTVYDDTEVRGLISANTTAISGKLDKPVEPVSGQGLNVPYYFDVNYSADKATVRDYTIDLLDKSKAPTTFSLDILSATTSNAGLMSASDKVKVNTIPDAPTADGTYTLECTVSGGVPTFNWVVKA